MPKNCRRLVTLNRLFQKLSEKYKLIEIEKMCQLWQKKLSDRESRFGMVSFPGQNIWRDTTLSNPTSSRQFLSELKLANPQYRIAVFIVSAPLSVLNARIEVRALIREFILLFSRSGVEKIEVCDFG